MKSDFLFNTRNTPELVGKVSYYDSHLKAAYDNNLLRIRFTEEVSSIFLALQFNDQLCQQQLKKIVAGTTSVAAIYWKDLKLFKIMLPPLPEQKKIASILTSVDDNIEEKQRKLATTQSLKKSLMQDLLTGKVRVN